MEIPLPTTDNFWLTLLVFVLFGSPALFSKTAAKAPGAFGAAARWWQNRSQNNSSAARIVTQANLSRIIDERVSEKVDHIEREVEELREELDDYNGYMTYDAAWHRQQNIHAAANGYEFAPPPHLSYMQWKFKKHNDGEGPVSLEKA